MNETELELQPAESIASSALASRDIDSQIATAKRYPRSIKKFLDEAGQMVTLTTDIADECIYALPRDGKTIEGPSARFAEVIASAWGNCRAGARVVADDGDFVTAQGAFIDLERNVAITYDVQRRITDKKGKRFSSDMVGVTANAACSIALRNAILKGVPKAFWSGVYDAARKTVAGDIKSLATRRAAALKSFAIYGVQPAQIFMTLQVAGIEDVTLDHLVVLRGMLTAIKDGDSTAEELFMPAPNGPVVGMAAAKTTPAPGGEAKAAPVAATPSPASRPATAPPSPPADDCGF